MVLHKLLTLTGPLGIWYREDNETIIHHKAAARVTCILSAEDAIVASRDPAQYSNPTAAFQPANALHTQPGQPNHPQQRRPGTHILSHLQNGLIQSRETGQELNRL